jgi:hypothetical protein
MLQLAGLAALASAASFGYYHFLHYSMVNGQYLPIPERFQLSMLPGSTLTYHIAENGPSAYATTDEFSLVVSQIRAAAKVWNDVETSALRLRFGGLTPQGANENAATPSIDVVFEDLPPGVNGYGGPTVRRDIVNTERGAIVPIQRSVVVLAKDIANRPSWSEQYFLTAVHEFGHALGLQHSFVSGAMATEITRATTKIRPILPDDVVGLSLLYPTAKFREGLGAITGRVTTRQNEPVRLASVVAIAPGGAAISTLTHPDGTYRIEGLPPGQYFLYTHALPPALLGEATPGNVVLPVDEANRPMAGGDLFDTVFYPANPEPAAAVGVVANETVDQIDFAVNRRTAPLPIHSVQTYSFPGQRAVKPAHVYTSGARNLVVLTGQGLIQNGQPAPGLRVRTIGGSVTVPEGGIRPYAPSPEYYLQADVQFGLFASESPLHLVFSRGTDVYVLPYGMRVVDRAAPQIESLQRTENGDVRAMGIGLNESTRLGFDGAFGKFRSYDEQTGALTVTPPPVAPGTTTHVVAFGADGQSSLFMQAAVELPGVMEPEVAPLALSVASLPAGTESLVEMAGTNLAEGQTSLGFGTPDIAVGRVWFTGPNRLMANVFVSAGAAGKSHSLTVLNGLRLSTLPGALQITAERRGWLGLAPTAEGGLVAGNAATIQVNGIALTPLTSLQVSLNDRPAVVLGVEGERVSIAVPSDLTPGFAVLRLIAGEAVALPLAVPVVRKPSTVSSVTAGATGSITKDRPAVYGETISLTISDLPENVIPSGSQPRIKLTVGGIEHQLSSVVANGRVLQLQFTIQTLVQQGVQPLEITVEDVPVQTYPLPVRAF